MRYQKTDGTLLRRYEWAYDDSNNRQSQLEVTPTKAVLWEYQVDWLDRLVAVKRAEAADVASLTATTLQRAYEFDESDNRTFFDDYVNGKTYHYTYKSIDDNGTTRYSDQLEEILVYNSAAGHRTVGDFLPFESLEHDADGNMTKRTIAATSEEIDYEWTEFNRLKRVESDQNGRMQDARYGVNGLRTRKLDKNGNSSVEHGVGIMTSTSVPGSGSSSAPSISYIHGGGELLGCEIDDGTGPKFVFHLSDALGSARDLIDDQGNLILSREWDEYGNLLSTVTHGSGPVSPKSWIGGLSVNDDTADSGLFLMGYRNFLGGVVGRFINRDPIGHRGNLNLYAYPTDPITEVDPDGLQWGAELLGAGAGGGSCTLGADVIGTSLSTLGAYGGKVVGLLEAGAATAGSLTGIGVVGVGSLAIGVTGVQAAEAWEVAALAEAEGIRLESRLAMMKKQKERGFGKLEAEERTRIARIGQCWSQFAKDTKYCLRLTEKSCPSGYGFEETVAICHQQAFARLTSCLSRANGAFKIKMPPRFP